MALLCSTRAQHRASFTLGLKCLKGQVGAAVGPGMEARPQIRPA